MEERMSDYAVHHVTFENIGCHRTLALDVRDFSAIEITGQGEAGKTTILDAIVACITGQDVATLVTQGEPQGKIEITFDGMRITRFLKDGKTQRVEILDTQDVRGEATRAQQTYLDRVFHGWIPRPIDLYYMKPKELVKAVMQASNIDCADATRRLQMITGDDWDIKAPEQVLPAIEQAYTVFYNRRRDANKLAKDIAAKADAMRIEFPDGRNPNDLPPPQMPTSVDALYRQREATREYQRVNQQRRIKRQEILQRIATLQAEADELAVLINAARTDVEIEDELNDLQGRIDAYEVELKNYQKVVAAQGEVRYRYKEWQSLSQQAQQAKTDADHLDVIVKNLETLPKEIMAQTELPMDGVELRDDGVYINGIPLPDRGDSRKLMFCVNLAMALCPPRFKFVLIDGCERLDPSQRAELLEYIHGKGFQAFMTRVTEGPLTVEYIDGPDTATAKETFDLFADQ